MDWGSAAAALKKGIGSAGLLITVLALAWSIGSSGRTDKGQQATAKKGMSCR